MHGRTSFLELETVRIVSGRWQPARVRRSAPSTVGSFARGILLLLLLTSPAWADPIDVADKLSADPDYPAVGLSFRDHPGATVGAPVPVIGDGGSGWTLRVPIMVELHNRLNNVAPNNYWRGLIGVEAGYRFDAPNPRLGHARLVLRLNHESDHATWGVAVKHDDQSLGFYEFNSLGAGGSIPFAWLTQTFVASAETRIHLVTCNTNLGRCGTGVDGWGSVGLELRGELVWPGPSSGVPGRWSPMAALFIDWLPPHALIRTERRLVAHVGIYLPTERRGTFELYLLGWWGNDVGFLRQQRIAQTGFGVRWSPP